jgi:hypothetical protein
MLRTLPSNDRCLQSRRLATGLYAIIYFIIHFMTSSVAQETELRMTGLLMNDEWWCGRKQSWLSQTCNPGIHLEGLRKIMKTSVRIIRVMANIRTYLLPNTSQRRYRISQLPGYRLYTVLRRDTVKVSRYISTFRRKILRWSSGWKW